MTPEDGKPLDIVGPASAPGSAESSGGILLTYLVGNVHDGRFANNAWLQELPDPVTKLTWGNAALISPRLADEYHLENEDVVELEVDGRKIEIPVWISPGQVDNSISVALGYGRTAAGRVGNGVGVDAYKLRTSDNMWFVSGVTIRKTGAKAGLACTQDHGSMEGRPIVRENTLAGYKEKAEFYPKEIEHPPLVSLWDEHKYDKGYQWGMSIDLNACTGCNACVVACQAENNIPVVGKEQVRNAREMHWMRIDRYYAGDINDPEVAVQPMNCQHCEMAPCEQVCPVAATSHDPEGLNVMVYNRCIGTRYCSNNCPYKVRRFNFFNYTKDLPELVQMAQNPEVTVRFRGVMEKCTYCIQRISAAKINAKNQGRTVADGEIKTACEAACPARAIVFGNINDPNSRVSQLKKNDRKYHVLEELNIRPRTSYLAKLRNPHPALAKEKPSGDKEHHG
jgi:Fe-S-cluster-containing dehydrogenase component